MPAQGMPDDMHSVAERRLRRIDQRYTSGRRAIVDLLVTPATPSASKTSPNTCPACPAAPPTGT